MTAPKVRKFGWHTRISLFPFEIAFAALAGISGFLTLTHLGTSAEELNTLLPMIAVQAVNFLYMLSGIAIILGLVLPRRDIEGFGLFQLAAGVAIRWVALLFFAGWSFPLFALGVLYTTIIWACVIRLRQLFIAKTKAVEEATNGH